MKYTCNKCNKIFAKKYNYTKHINRKNPCDNNIFEINNIEIPLQDNVDIIPNVNNNKCPYCYKIFFQKSNVLIHINNKSCNTEEDMNLIELIVLKKLKLYKEKANRDRFILPIEKEISFFINMIDECIKYII